MIKVSAYELSNDNWREERLYRALSAVRSFLAHSTFEDRDIDAHLVSIHDHKGNVDAVWVDQTSLASFSELLDLAWKFQGEPSEYNQHCVQA